MNAAVLATATTSFYSRFPLSYNSTFPVNHSPNCKLWRRGATKLNKMRCHLICQAARRKSSTSNDAVSVFDSNQRKVIQAILWVAEGVYVLWLFLLPYAPGDPVWAISRETVDSLIGLSLNFFFILPFLNSVDVVGRVVGIHYLESPLLHPMAEGLFNFVIGWTFMFAPLLFTDKKKDRFKGSLDVLWGAQMFLTNSKFSSRLGLVLLYVNLIGVAPMLPAFLIPYMAIRLNEADTNQSSSKRSQLGTVMTNGASVVGLIGGAACLISVLWALYGRPDSGFGSITDRWEYLIDYLGGSLVAWAPQRVRSHKGSNPSERKIPLGQLHKGSSVPPCSRASRSEPGLVSANVSRTPGGSDQKKRGWHMPSYGIFAFT